MFYFCAFLQKLKWNLWSAFIPTAQKMSLHKTVKGRSHCHAKLIPFIWIWPVRPFRGPLDGLGLLVAGHRVHGFIPDPILHVTFANSNSINCTSAHANFLKLRSKQKNNGNRYNSQRNFAITKATFLQNRRHHRCKTWLYGYGKVMTIFYTKIHFTRD